MRHSTYPERDYRFGRLFLAHRTESNLTQSGLAELLGVSRQSVVGWETGTSYPSPQHLKHLIEQLLRTHAFHSGQEAEEIRALWQSAHQRVPLDETWLTHLLEKPPQADAAPHGAPPRGKPPAPGPQIDWGDAPEVSSFYGRKSELMVLTDWLLAKRCRVVSVLGMGGMGKTSLAARLVQEVAPLFECVFWRSLRDAPLPAEWLASAINFISGQTVTPPAATSERLIAILQLLRTRRCLLVLDNFDTLFEPGQVEGRYRADLAGYAALLRAIGETSHQSCLLLTSREAPAELAMLTGNAVRTLPLAGLGVSEVQQVLAPKQLVGSPQQWAELTDRFGGNSLALKLVGERIRELFGGEISLYLEEVGASSVFGGIRQLLAEQVGRSTATEQQVLRALALAREPVRLAELLAALSPRIDREMVLEALEALRRRSLVEHNDLAGSAAFTLQSVVLEYLNDILVEEVVEEISNGQPDQLIKLALIRAQARDFVRQSQERLVGTPILERLKARFGQSGAEQLLLALVDVWRGQPTEKQGYGPGNVVNLLRLLRGDLRWLDLSNLAIRQAYLAEVEAQDASLAGAYLTETVLAEAFSFALSVALSGDGELLAAGTSTGQVWLWRVKDRTLMATLEGHTGQVMAVSFSADGRWVASGGADGTVRLWDASTGRSLATLEGHTTSILGVVFSADGRLLASGSLDETVRLWEAPSGKPLGIFAGHTGGVWGITLSTDSRLLVSGSADGVVRLWDTRTGQLQVTMKGHSSAVWGVALSADGHLLASGGLDGIIRLWDVPGGKIRTTLQGHTGGVWSLAISPNGHTLVSSGADGPVRLWEVPSGLLLTTLHGHTGGVRGVALSEDGHMLVSGGLEGTIRMWEMPSGQPLATLQGHTGGIWRVAFSNDGQLLASSDGDGAIRLWDTESGRELTVIQGHTAEVRVVVLSADGRMLVSGGMDGRVRLWEAPSGRSIATLEGHTSPVWGLALSLDGQLIASGDLGGTVRLWDVSNRKLLATLKGHTGGVRQVALSADGHLVASASMDGTVRLWEAPGGQPLATLKGHTSPVWGVALSAEGDLLASADIEGTVRLWETPRGRPLAIARGHTGSIWGVALTPDGRLVASGGMDGTVRLWEAPGGQPLVTLRGHVGPTPAVALSSNGHLLASGGWDGTVRLWEAPSGAYLRTLQAERRYARLDITGLTGITEAQRRALMALGAVEIETSAGTKHLPDEVRSVSAHQERTGHR